MGLGAVTVPTEYLITRRVVVVLEPAVDLNDVPVFLLQLSTMLGAVSIDMVNGEELHLSLSAALADCATIGVEDFLFEVPFVLLAYCSTTVTVRMVLGPALGLALGAERYLILCQRLRAVETLVRRTPR